MENAIHHCGKIVLDLGNDEVSGNFGKTKNETIHKF